MPLEPSPAGYAGVVAGQKGYNGAQPVETALTRRGEDTGLGHAALAGRLEPGVVIQF